MALFFSFNLNCKVLLGLVLLFAIFLFYSNQLDRDRVWTFGSGPRMCIGHKFIHKIIKVCAQDQEKVNRTLSLLTTIPKNVTLPPLRDILKEWL